MNMKINVNEIKKIRKKIDNLEIEEILKYIALKYKDDIAMTTAFGYSGIVLMYYLKDIMPSIPIYFIDTGYHFKETLQLCKTVKEKWKLNIIEIKPTFDKIQIKKIIGTKPYETNSNLCCHYLKVESFLRVINTKKILLSAIRRDQVITSVSLQVMR